MAWDSRSGKQNLPRRHYPAHSSDVLAQRVKVPSPSVRHGSSRLGHEDDHGVILHPIEVHDRNARCFFDVHDITG